MGNADIVVAILKEMSPAKKTDLVRKIWPEIEALLEARLTHKQIAGELHRFGVDMSYRQFIAASWAIRNKGRKRPRRIDPQQSGVTPRQVGRPRKDVLASANQKIEASKTPHMGGNK